MQMNVNLHFQTTGNSTNAVRLSIPMTAIEIKTDTTLVIPQPCFMARDCWCALIYLEISLGRLEVQDDEDWIQNIAINIHGACCAPGLLQSTGDTHRWTRQGPSVNFASGNSTTQNLLL